MRTICVPGRILRVLEVFAPNTEEDVSSLLLLLMFRYIYSCVELQHTQDSSRQQTTDCSWPPSDCLFIIVRTFFFFFLRAGLEDSWYRIVLYRFVDKRTILTPTIDIPVHTPITHQLQSVAKRKQSDRVWIEPSRLYLSCLCWCMLYIGRKWANVFLRICAASGLRPYLVSISTYLYWC